MNQFPRFGPVEHFLSAREHGVSSTKDFGCPGCFNFLGAARVDSLHQFKALFLRESENLGQECSNLLGHVPRITAPAARCELSQRLICRSVVTNTTPAAALSGMLKLSSTRRLKSSASAPATDARKAQMI